MDPMSRIRTLGMVAALVVLTAAPARRDINALIGPNAAAANRQVRGGALGLGLLGIGFELEYAFTPDEPAASAPSLKTGMGNLMLQTPVAVFGFQPYFTTGGGFYQEELGAHSDTGFGVN